MTDRQAELIARAAAVLRRAESARRETGLWSACVAAAAAGREADRLMAEAGFVSAPEPVSGPVNEWPPPSPGPGLTLVARG